MNRDDLKKFRAIFEEEMTREGFIWRYQTYLHIDFSQYWILAVWPGVTGQGHLFDMYYGLFLMNAFDPGDLKTIHSDNLISMKRRFNLVDPTCKPPFNDLMNNEESYKLAFEIYCRDVKPVFQQIQDPYDVYLFRKNYTSFPFEANSLWLETGKKYIEYLLFIKREDEIPKVMKRIKNGQDEWEERYNMQEPPVYKEPSLLGHTPKSAARLIEALKKSADLQMKQYEREKQRIVETRKQIAELEHMLQTTDHGELRKQIEDNMKNVALIIKSKFSKIDIQTMSDNWTKN